MPYKGGFVSMEFLDLTTLSQYWRRSHLPLMAMESIAWLALLWSYLSAKKRQGSLFAAQWFGVFLFWSALRTLFYRSYSWFELPYTLWNGGEISYPLFVGYGVVAYHVVVAIERRRRKTVYERREPGELRALLAQLWLFLTAVMAVWYLLGWLAPALSGRAGMFWPWLQSFILTGYFAFHTWAIRQGHLFSMRRGQGVIYSCLSTTLWFVLLFLLEWWILGLYFHFIAA